MTPRVELDLSKAERLLTEAGFSEEEGKTVIAAALRNRFDPVAYAERAIRLREHVAAGKPL